MKNLRVWQKLTLMGVVLTIPFAVVTWQMVSEIRTLAIENAHNELKGLEYFRPIAAAIKDLQQHRTYAVAVASGDATFKGPLASKTAEVQSDLNRLDETAQRAGASLVIQDKWRAFVVAARNAVEARDLSASDTFDRHTQVIGEGIALITDLGDSYQLNLDTSLDTYYLANFIILKGPELAEVVAQARGIGTGVIAAKTATPAQLQALSRLAVLSTFLQARLDKSLSRALAANAALRSELESEVRASSAAIKAAAERISRLSTGKIDIGAADYHDDLTRGVSSIFDLQNRAIGSLNEIMRARIASFERDMYETILGAAVGLLIVSLIGFYIARDVTVSLGRVVGVANQIAAGDLSVHAMPSRKDEIGGLAHAFDGMVRSLKETAGMAERIAAGDLAVTVTPKSDRDVLGGSLANMVERLSALLGDVKKSGLQVDESVNDIAATARQQQVTASEIAATTSQIGATSKEISATSRELVKTMNEVSSVADHSAALAGNGQAGLTRMEATMRHVMEAAASINAKLAVLNEKAGDINHVVTTITKVADQTNLLSLNAAIEAEKAGEYGRGFAVVATEIRRLADQTAVATYDIDQMVKQIQSAVSAGVMGMDKFAEEVRRGMQDVQLVGDQLSQIIQQVQALAPRCEAVNEGMEAQASGAEQISQALGQLSEAAQQTVESLRQSGKAIETLHEAATGMRSGVARFNLAA